MSAAPEEVLRVANCSGFYGDRLSAAREMVEGGPIDVLTGDYLAELTLTILKKDQQKDERLGYAKTFPLQLRDIAASCLERGIKIVVNAGGLNPEGCADACRSVYRQLGLEAKIAHIRGDDLLPRLAELQEAGEPFAHMGTGAELASSPRQVVSANAYLGGWGIAEALGRGADLVICPRVTDAALVVGPAAWRFGWAQDDWDRLASAVVAGHILECGAQATGGNYAFWRKIDGLEKPGFPLAEIEADGSFTVTKHPGTGGEVSVGTVTAQLLYEIDSPRYANPDVTARFDSIRLEDAGADRVRVTGVCGEPPPPTTKVCLNQHGGFKNSVTFLLTGLDVEAKAELAEKTLWRSLGGRGSFAETHVSLHRAPELGPETSFEASFSRLRVAVQDSDAAKVGRRFAAAAVEMALASYPGFNLTAPPGRGSAFGVYWPALVASEHIRQQVVFEGESFDVPSTPGDPAPKPAEPEIPHGINPPSGPTRSVPLGEICATRSGDKGGDANLGVWTLSEEAYAWLHTWLTVDRLRGLIPEARDLMIERHALPNLYALNFMLRGFLGEGVAASLALDAQAKGLGEFLRARRAAVPVCLLEGSPVTESSHTFGRGISSSRPA